MESLIMLSWFRKLINKQTDNKPTNKETILVSQPANFLEIIAAVDKVVREDHTDLLESTYNNIDPKYVVAARAHLLSLHICQVFQTVEEWNKIPAYIIALEHLNTSEDQFNKYLDDVTKFMNFDKQEAKTLWKETKEVYSQLENSNVLPAEYLSTKRELKKFQD